MQDLQSIKNQLISLSYSEKIEMSEWLHTQIDFERAEAVREKAKEVNGQLNSFLSRASQVTKTAGNSLLDSFRAISSSDENKNLPDKK